MPSKCSFTVNGKPCQNRVTGFVLVGGQKRASCPSCRQAYMFWPLITKGVAPSAPARTKGQQPQARVQTGTVCSFTHWRQPCQKPATGFLTVIMPNGTKKQRPCCDHCRTKQLTYSLNNNKRYKLNLVEKK